MKTLKSLIYALLFLILLVSSCKKDEVLTDPTAKLEFSTDSVLFDTVFKYAGSTTKVFTIHNRQKQTLNISKVFLAGGSTSDYKLNVDGLSTSPSVPVLNDIEIMGGDSLFVFVQVHVTPSQNAPLLIRDSIIFETNGNIQDVKLTAIGQDVHLIKPDHFPTNGFPAYSIIGRSGFDTTFINDKPYLVFGYAVVDEACTLTINPGVHMYFHNNACLMVFDGGTLVTQGSKNNETVYQGDRLEADYKDLPGQWRGIWLWPGSKNNIIDWAIIKNGSIGIQADTVVTPGTPTLKLTNTIIKNMQVAALYGLETHIWSNNCLFANCGQYVVALTGGSYKFEHCTFANYWTGGQRATPLLVMNNYYTSGNTTYIRPMDSCYFGNCILFGDIDDEIGVDTLNGYPISFKFDHCLLKTGFNTANSGYFNTVYKNNQPGFRDPAINDYQINGPTAFAVDKGDPILSIPRDLNYQPRPNTSHPNPLIPDLGAYEFY